MREDSNEGGRGKMCVVFLHEMVLRIERERERERGQTCVCQCLCLLQT